MCTRKWKFPAIGYAIPSLRTISPGEPYSSVYFTICIIHEPIAESDIHLGINVTVALIYGYQVIIYQSSHFTLHNNSRLAPKTYYIHPITR